MTESEPFSGAVDQQVIIEFHGFEAAALQPSRELAVLAEQCTTPEIGDVVTVRALDKDTFAVVCLMPQKAKARSMRFTRQSVALHKNSRRGLDTVFDGPVAAADPGVQTFITNFFSLL